ncbi:MAG: ferrous iron transporter B [SAR324 cluster bacterium]|nr:ferrous iron transporter B [SAR324 cluster bacterium]
MTKCKKCHSDQHDACETSTLATSNAVIIGNMNVGKSTLFSRLSGSQNLSVNIPGTTVSVSRGQIKGLDSSIYDTPGIYSLFSQNEDERASRDVFLMPGIEDHQPCIILLADAKKLKQSLALTLQYAEYGLPMVFVVNMVDEAPSRGISINYHKLSEKLGIPVFTTIAREGIGVPELVAGLGHARKPKALLHYSDKVEQYLELVEKLLSPQQLSSRAIGLLLLSGDIGIETYVERKYGSGMLLQLQQLAEDYRQESPTAFEIPLSNLYNKEATKLAEEVQTKEPPSENPLVLRFGDWCTQLSTGIPIAFGVVTLMYYFVGAFGATFLVDTINGTLFEGFLIPWTTQLVSYLPSEFFRDMLVDPDFGVLPTGVFLALGLVLPVIFCFYIAFGILEDSGYLPRVAILLDRIFRKMGLNGKGVIPLTMGFSCVTMAILTTRVLNTDKEKNIASFLLFLCMPCAPLIAVMFIILDSLPVSATITVFFFIFSQLILAGMVANKIMVGGSSSMVFEIPTMRVPKLMDVVKMSALKTYFFMKEAVPVFIFAAIVVFLFQRFGGLKLVETAFGPMIDSALGLPEQSIQVFIKTMIRRESGAAELEHLRGLYTNLQLVVNLLLMIFLAPCINAIIVLFKERGSRAASTIMIAVVAYAIILCSIVNHVCRWLGVTFV